MKHASHTMISIVTLIFVVLPNLLFGQALLLNEIVSSNSASLSDEDGNSPDWIEIYNPAPNTVNLQGYSLSDDIEELDKWTFETGQIVSGGHVIIFASDKDRQGLNINWHLIITEGTLWHYFVGSSNPPANWKSLDFTESQWSQGPSGFGYGDNDDNTIIPTTMSVYLRKRISIPDTSAISGLLFHINYDDGYIAYMNGVEFSRMNMGAPGTPANNTTAADSYTEPALIQGFDLPFTIIPRERLQNGDNVIAIEVHNHSTSSSDLTATPFLSLGEIGGSAPPLPDYLLQPESSRFHTNFKINSSGEMVMLSGPDGEIRDSVSVPGLPPDISWGRDSDGGDNWLYFNPPTPGETNNGGSLFLPQPPDVSPQPGFYNGGIPFSLGTIPEGIVYKYTLDGSKPDLNSSNYTSTLYFTQTTVVRVMSSAPDGTNPFYASYSYFLNEDPYLPVMSLIFEPGAFFDNDTGMYAMGPDADEAFPYFGSNFWEDWEREVHIEYFEDGQALSYSSPAGAKIFGGWSRGNPQRSLSLFARSRYGSSDFEYPFFPDLDLESYEALVLRNAGNDWNMSGYRDGFMTGLVTDQDIDRQAFQPVEVYFNGEYWGIYNLREKVNEHFLASHHDLDTESIDLLGLDGSEVIHGDNSDYLSLINYVNSHALVTDQDFEFVEEKVDVRNFIDYQLSQIYFDNWDWPGNNIKFWRSHAPGGKWRWILYDTDFGFSIWSNNNYIKNTLGFATDPNGPGWPNPPWSTLLLRKFLTNPDFKRDFILTACDLLNQPFSYDVVHEALIRHQQWIQLSIPNHFARWNHNSIGNWFQEGVIMNTFAVNRGYYMRNHFRSKFNLGSDSQIMVNVQPDSAGLIRVHSIIPESYPWTGEYFSDVPLDVKAIALPGYQFSHWEGIGGSDPERTVSLLNDLELTAVFIPLDPGDGALVINEINYHSSNDYDCGDWIELYNGTQQSVDLSGWIVSDGSDENQFMIPEFELPSNAYIIVCNDSTAFRTVHGPSASLVGDLDFNFSNGGELIRIFNADNMLVDSVRYDDEAPWPVEPDGEGPTLELTNPALDNSLSTSWAVSDEQGTPGFQNSRFVDPSGISSSNRPLTLRLGMAYPNPFNSRVSLPFDVQTELSFQFEIYDIRGRLVRSESYEPSVNSSKTFYWDGRNDYGKDCSTGLYIVQLRQKGMSISRKIALLR